MPVLSFCLCRLPLVMIITMNTYTITVDADLLTLGLITN